VIAWRLSAQELRYDNRKRLKRLRSSCSVGLLGLVVARRDVVGSHFLIVISTNDGFAPPYKVYDFSELDP
jgi:hypothetical protein